MGDSSFHKNSRRIFLNTIMLYIRQILILVVNLFTARIVLQKLGAEDYGIQNVVGGFVSLFNIVSGAFSVAISRFMSYVLGGDDDEELRSVYSASVVVQIASGLLVGVFLATLGVYYVKNIMVLPSERIHAALWLLLFSWVSFFTSLLYTPHNALIVAHERMQAFAYIGIIEALLKLAVAFALFFGGVDKLILYGALNALSAVVVRFLYAIYCKRNFPECHFTTHIDKKIFRKMFSFTGWAFLGNGSIVLKDQGLNMLLNLFGGPVVNAARGIAVSAGNALSSLANNYSQAVQPQITKLISVGNRDEAKKLIGQSTRCAYFLMMLISLPVMKNINYVLQIWLGEVPPYTAEFIVFTLVDAMISAINGPIVYGVLAEGNIRNYEIALFCIYTSSLPLAYLALSAGMGPEVVYYITVFLRMLVTIALVCASRSYGITFGWFAKEVVSRILLVTALSAAITWAVRFEGIPAFAELVAETLAIVCGSALVVFALGLKGSERKAMLTYAQAAVNKVKSHRRVG